MEETKRHSVLKDNLPKAGDILVIDLQIFSFWHFQKLVDRALIRIVGNVSVVHGVIWATWTLPLPLGTQPVGDLIHGFVDNNVLTFFGPLNTHLRAKNLTQAIGEFYSAVLIQRTFRRNRWKRRWTAVMGELEALPGAIGYNHARDHWRMNVQLKPR